MTLPRLTMLREFRCSGPGKRPGVPCGRLLARLNLERGVIEIVCKECKAKNVLEC